MLRRYTRDEFKLSYKFSILTSKCTFYPFKLRPFEIKNCTDIIKIKYLKILCFNVRLFIFFYLWAEAQGQPTLSAKAELAKAYHEGGYFHEKDNYVIFIVIAWCIKS